MWYVNGTEMNSFVDDRFPRKNARTVEPLAQMLFKKIFKKPYRKCKIVQHGSHTSDGCAVSIEIDG